MASQDVPRQALPESKPKSMYVPHYQRLYFPATKQLLTCLVQLMAEVDSPRDSPFVYLNIKLQSIRASLAPLYLALFNKAANTIVATCQPTQGAQSSSRTSSIDVKIIFRDVMDIFVGYNCITLVFFDKVKLVYRPNYITGIREVESANINFWKAINYLYQTTFSHYFPTDFSAFLRNIPDSSPMKGRLLELMRGKNLFKHYYFKSIPGKANDGRQYMILEYLADYRLGLILMAHGILEGAKSNDETKCHIVSLFRKLRANYVHMVKNLLSQNNLLIIPFLDPYHQFLEVPNQKADVKSSFFFFDSLKQEWQKVVHLVAQKGRLLFFFANGTFINLLLGDVHFIRYFLSKTVQTLTFYRACHASGSYWQIVTINEETFQELWGHTLEWLDITQLIPVMLEKEEGGSLKKDEGDGIAVMDILNQNFGQQGLPPSRDQTNAQFCLKQLNGFMSLVVPGADWPSYFVVRERWDNLLQRKGSQALIALDCKRLLRQVLHKLAIDQAMTFTPKCIPNQPVMFAYERILAQMKVYYGEEVPFRWEGLEMTALAQFEEQYSDFEAPI